MQIRNKKLFWIICGSLALPALIYMTSMAMEHLASSPPSPQLPPAPATSSAPSVPASASSSAAGPGSRQASAPATSNPHLEPVPVPVAGNLEGLTALRAELEELRIKSAIAAEAEKLNPKAPVVVAAPHSASSLPSEAETPPKSSAAPPPTGPVVLSVQGLDGHARAIVRHGSELVTLRPGDRFDGGVVASVTRSGVFIRRNGKATILPFE